eukprot:Awhi_evm1s3122
MTFESNATATTLAIQKVINFDQPFHILIVIFLGTTFNMIANGVTTTNSNLRWRKWEFVLSAIIRDSLCTTVRYFIWCRGGGISICLLWPLTLFETFSTQFMGDRYSQRSTLGVCWSQIWTCLRVAIVEGSSSFLGLQLFKVADISLVPSSLSIVRMVYFCPIFDLGLDLGFYTFHRLCHSNRFLYKLVHADHHLHTAKKYGRLVAFETYTITLIETISITSSYFIGLLFVIGVNGGKPLSILELAILLTWGHSIELLGHTAMSGTPKWHPFRLVIEMLQLDLHVIDHTMHHKIPKSNFSKRMTLFDILCGTYSPRDENITYKAGDELITTNKKQK